MLMFKVIGITKSDELEIQLIKNRISEIDKTIGSIETKIFALSNQFTNAFKEGDAIKNTTIPKRTSQEKVAKLEEDNSTAIAQNVLVMKGIRKQETEWREKQSDLVIEREILLEKIATYKMSVINKEIKSLNTRKEILADQHQRLTIARINLSREHTYKAKNPEETLTIILKSTDDEISNKLTEIIAIERQLRVLMNEKELLDQS
ncbi:MAG: hypothetical protein A2Y40_07990 [Candidatus Margulisbacteria bacterium GWF2_35_9]|nr:MAG: hypothetical protein A2Y40_07990 [Candidatus Margulisbacteria bacterium GWF2_35_9]